MKAANIPALAAFSLTSFASDFAMNPQTPNNLPALVQSILSGTEEDVVRWLQEDPHLLSARAKNGNGWAAIHHAAAAGELAIVRALLDAGFDPNLPSGEDDGEGTWVPGEKAVSIAVWKDHLPIVQHLIDRGASPDSTDHFGHTSIHVAALHNRVEHLNLLLSRGANPNAFSHRRHFDEVLDWHFLATPLHLAAMNNAAEAARVLLAHGARQDECWTDQRTPLFYAAATGSDGVAEVLLLAGADPNQRECRKGYSAYLDYTPLHYAASHGRLAVIEVLLKHGADPNLRETQRNLTALELARNRDHQSVVFFLDSLKRPL
jgi:ankyrin repeat protein